MIYKNILVAIDGSDIAKQALNEALKFAKEQSDVKLRLIHVIDSLFINWSMQPICPKTVHDSLKNSALEVLKEAQTYTKAQGVNNVETELIELKTPDQRIAEAIAIEAHSWPANLLVVGTHGRRGFNEFVLGSVAIGVIKIATVPVLLIRGQ